jgi:hypothetical protein
MLNAQRTVGHKTIQCARVGQAHHAFVIANPTDPAVTWTLQPRGQLLGRVHLGRTAKDRRGACGETCEMNVVIVQARKQRTTGSVDQLFARFGGQGSDRCDLRAGNAQVGKAVAINLDITDQHEIAAGA